MSYKAIIFDLDGTLLDTLEDIADAVNRVLASRGFPVHDLAAYRYFVGDGSEMLLKRALPEKQRSDTAVKRSLTAFKKNYENAWDIKTRPYGGIPELLDCLAEKGVRMAVCSNKPHEFSVLCVEKYLDRWRFEEVVGQGSLYRRKPSSDGALAIAGHMGIDPQKILFVGDSGVDMRTAVSAGMCPVGALWGFRSEAELVENGCRFLARHPLDVLKTLQS